MVGVIFRCPTKFHGETLGFNSRVFLFGPGSSYGDPEYLAAFRCVVVPVAREFGPDIILVSAGFNATGGHPHTLGGYTVTPQCEGDNLV